MLLWQWKNVHKKIALWGHLVSIILVLHIFLGYIFFSWLRHGVQHVMLTMQRDVSKIPVVFARRPLAAQPTVNAVHAARVPAQDVTKKTPSLNTAIVQPKLSQKKNTKTTQKKIPEKKPLVKKEIKKEAPPKKVVQPKKELPVKKEEFKKVTEKVVPLVEKFTEQVLSPIAGTSAALIAEARPASIIDETEYAPANREEAELYALVAQHWAPPVGIAAAHVCEVSVEIGWNQEIHKAWISKKSGILMYDLAARKAVMQTKFPLWTRGKTVTIQFVQ